MEWHCFEFADFLQDQVRTRVVRANGWSHLTSVSYLPKYTGQTIALSICNEQSKIRELCFTEPHLPSSFCPRPGLRWHCLIQETRPKWLGIPYEILIGPF